MMAFASAVVAALAAQRRLRGDDGVDPQKAIML
jgi:hypothetical protein